MMQMMTRVAKKITINLGNKVISNRNQRKAKYLVMKMVEIFRKIIIQACTTTLLTRTVLKQRKENKTGWMRQGYRRIIRV